MAFTFKGGVHPREWKLTERSPIAKLPASAHLEVPLQQHIGAPAAALVQKGEGVKLGQVIADNANALCCPVHAPVSGTITGITTRMDASGRMIEYIGIDNDFADTLSETVLPHTRPILETSAEEIIARIRAAGISGMGGAGFPAYAKLSSAIESGVDKLIVNACECEPYLTADHRLLLEHPDAVVGGIQILMRALDLADATIAIEDNKRDAAILLRSVIQNDLIRVHLLQTKYPQGDERQIVFAVTGRQIPAGKLPKDAGCVIFNAATCAAIYDAFVTGLPLVSRIVTVSGDCVKKPSNVRVPIGTAFKDVIEFCGGYSAEPDKLIAGGPMMGVCQWDDNAVVTKTTSGILALSKVPHREADVCVHCGKCALACPMYLEPLYLAAYARIGQYERCKDFDVFSCVECGSCAHVCPGGVPLVQYIRTAKVKLKELAAAKK